MREGGSDEGERKGWRERGGREEEEREVGMDGDRGGGTKEVTSLDTNSHFIVNCFPCPVTNNDYYVQG